MSPHSTWSLVALSLKRHKGAGFSAVFGISLGVASLVFFVSLGMGVNRVIREKVFPLDMNLIEVAEPQLKFANILGGGIIDESAIERFSKLENVERVYKKMNIRAPSVTRYNGNFFGSRLNIGLEIIAVGIDPTLVEKDLKGSFVEANGRIPVILSTRMIELYNKTFAPARGLPNLSANMLWGFVFPVSFNRSYVTQKDAGPTIDGQFQIAGISDRGMTLGVLIPLDAARRINGALGLDDKTYTGAVLRVRDVARLPETVKAIRDMGYRVDDVERRLSESIGAGVLVATLCLTLLTILLALLAGLNMSHVLTAAVKSQEKELAVFRAVGAYASDISRLVLAQAFVLATVGALVGISVAFVLMRGSDAAAREFLPTFPFKPETFFMTPNWVWLSACGLAFIFAFFGALVPSRRARKVDPIRVLAG